MQLKAFNEDTPTNCLLRKNDENLYREILDETEEKILNWIVTNEHKNKYEI